MTWIHLYSEEEKNPVTQKEDGKFWLWLSFTDSGGKTQLLNQIREGTAPTQDQPWEMLRLVPDSWGRLSTSTSVYLFLNQTHILFWLPYFFVPLIFFCSCCTDFLIKVKFHNIKLSIFKCTIQIFPWRRKRQPTPGFLPGESRGQRSRKGYGPWGRKSQTRQRYLSFFLLIHSQYYISNTPIFKTFASFRGGLHTH